MNSCCLKSCRGHPLNTALQTTLKITAAITGTLLCASLLTSCRQTEPGSASNLLRCDAATTPIAAVQGDGYASTMVGSDVTIRGITTRLEPGTGFYIEEPGSDASPTSSNAIFVENKVLSHAAKLGQIIIISGQVAELGKAKDTLTALTGISSHQLCDSNIDLPQTHMELPLNSRQREAMESMRITLDQNLSVSDVYNLHRGEVTLSAGGVLGAPTEHHQPGPLSTSAAKKNQRMSVRIALPGSSRPLLLTGFMVDQVNGIMGNNGKGQVFLLEQPLKSDRPQSPELKPPDNDHIRLVSFNLLNFFNGDGRGGGFPTGRGAKTHDDFLAQANRIGSAIAVIKPHLLAVQELENDGFGPLSATRTLVKLLKEFGHGSWSAVEPTSARIGKDDISVGLFYRSDILEPAGPAHILDSAPFRGINRQPLAQLFQDRSTGQRFLVAVIHLKSKVSCPKTGKNSDQRDGQGCWNPARVAAAKAVAGWLNGLAVQSGTDRILILGDMNSARNEDPVRVLRNQGFTELVEQIAGLPQHSYVYRGETSTLDYAFASDAVLPSVSHAQIWHINSEWPQKMELPRPWLRSSDHDPVVVDLDFNQRDTSD